MTSTPSPAAVGIAPPPWRSSGALLIIWLASAVVILVSLLTSFRIGFGEDLRTLLLVNGPRVLLGAAVGVALALSGALRLASGTERPLREIQILALSTGAAGGGFLLSEHRAGATGLVLFALGAAAGVLLLLALVRWLDRPKRWTNLLVVAAISGMATVAALVGTYARARRDSISAAVAWLLGDLTGASFASGLVLLGLVLLLIRVARRGERSQQRTVALISFGLATGAVGPLAFVGTLAPRTVRWLAQGASTGALIPACAVAGAATVVAVDAVPRLLLGGYDFPWNLPAAMLAIPIFGWWNRARLRREVGPAGLAFEVLEIGLLVGLTIGGILLANVLTQVIRAVT